MSNKFYFTRFMRNGNFIKAFDNTGVVDEPETGENDFSEDLIPEDKRESFNKFKQSLIDKGVDIGTARSKAKAEKNKGREIEEFFESKGLSKDQFEKRIGLLSKADAIDAILERYGTDDPEVALKMIEDIEAEESTTEEEEFTAEQEEAIKQAKAELAKKQKELEALEREKGEIATKASTYENLLKKRVVNSAIQAAAVEAGAYEAADVVERLSKYVTVKIVDGEAVPIIVDDEGIERFNNDAKPLSIQELVNEFLEARPHLRKATVKTGVGSKGGQDRVQIGEFTKEQLSDPKFVQDNYDAIMLAIKKGSIKL
jgi:hypothetical protein